jgi:hypothetical protein
VVFGDDIGDSNAAAGPEYPEHFREDGGLVDRSPDGMVSILGGGFLSCRMAINRRYPFLWQSHATR